jgi:hypothetical protein
MLQACWQRRGHPGWALLPLDTAAFEASCSHLQSVVLPPELAAAAIPLVPHSSTGFLAPSMPASLPLPASPTLPMGIPASTSAAALPHMVPISGSWPGGLGTPLLSTPVSPGASPSHLAGATSPLPPAVMGGEAAMMEEFASLRTRVGPCCCCRIKPCPSQWQQLANCIATNAASSQDVPASSWHGC